MARSPPSQPKEDVSGVDLNDCEAVDLHGCDEAFANVDYDALGNDLDDDDGADDEQIDGATRTRTRTRGWVRDTRYYYSSMLEPSRLPRVCVWCCWGPRRRPFNKRITLFNRLVCACFERVVERVGLSNRHRLPLRA